MINCAAYNDVDKTETDKKVWLLNAKAPKKLSEFSRVYIILCKLIDEFSKFNTLPFYLHKNFYTLEFSWKLIQTERFGLYHITNDGIASKYDQAKYVLEKIGWKGTLGRAKTADFNLPAKRPAYSKLDSSKVEKLLGEKIPTWQSGIDRFLEKMKENGEL